MKKGKTHENGIKEDPWTGVITSCETKTSPSWPAQFASGSREEGDKHIKGGSQDRLRPLLWGWLARIRSLILSLLNKTEL